MGAESEKHLPAIPMNGRGVVLATLEDAFRFAKMVCISGLAPKSFDAPEKVLVAVQAGAELGLSAIVSLQNMAVINGKMTIMGDLAKALVQNSAVCEYIKPPQWTGTLKGGDRACTVTSKRTDQEQPLVTIFGIEEAKIAKLWGKRGKDGQDTPWITYPERMLYYRALSFNLRDNFADVLKGIHLTEEFEGQTIAPLDATRIVEAKVVEDIKAAGGDPTDLDEVERRVQQAEQGALGHEAKTAEDWQAVATETAEAEPEAEAPSEPPADLFKDPLLDLKTKINDSVTGCTVELLDFIIEKFKADGTPLTEETLTEAAKASIAKRTKAKKGTKP
ncbi:MAG TPA: hypothetical protein VM238_18615 [Phycisphaerae bacterium]|nr:hypothetical protein [Phycisphaerae bacterium]